MTNNKTKWKAMLILTPWSVFGPVGFTWNLMFYGVVAYLLLR